MPYGDTTYTPAAPEFVDVECGGAGSGAGNAGAQQVGCGGGGGAYSRRMNISLAVAAWGVRAGYPSNVAGNHESFFVNGFFVMAMPATGGGFGTPGVGGQAASGFGDVKFSGGDGGPDPGINLPGTGGGSSADRAGDGQDGGSGGAGGIAPNGGGGDGGDGTPQGNGAGPPGGDSLPGNPGTAPGGGGGGAGAGVNGNPGAAGYGEGGYVIIWTHTGYWPPVPGDVPLFVWGTPPSNAIPTANVKARKVAFIM